ncbi:hypothetical protein ACET3Z_004423 [Daucus carota]
MPSNPLSMDVHGYSDGIISNAAPRRRGRGPGIENIYAQKLAKDYANLSNHHTLIKQKECAAAKQRGRGPGVNNFINSQRAMPDINKAPVVGVSSWQI